MEYTFVKTHTTRCHNRLRNRFQLPNNKDMALSRLTQLKRRLQTNEKFRNDYNSFMTEIISKGYAKEIPIEGQVFYIPHHSVYKLTW